MPPPPDAWLKALAALVSAAFAVVVLAGGPRRAPNAFLAGFLLLIAANQGFETMRSFATEDESALLLRFRLATVAAALDPLFLYYFASIYPDRSSLNRAPYVVAVGAVSALFAAVAVTARPIEATDTMGALLLIGLTLFTGVVYATVLVHALRRASRPAAPPASFHVYAALCFAAIPVVARAGTHFVTLPPLVATPLQHALGRALVAVVAVAAFTFLLRRRVVRGPFPRRVATATGAAAAIALLPYVFEVVGSAAAMGLLHEVWGGLAGAAGRAVTPVRWLVFGALMSVAILRHDLLGHSLSARRLGARAFLGLVFLVAAALAFGLAHVATGTPPLGSAAAELVILVLVLILSQGFRTLVDRAAERLYGVPFPSDTRASHEAYRMAVVQALTEGRVPEASQDLARLRRELALDETTARVLEGVAKSASHWPLEAGRLVEGRYRVRELIGAGGAGRAFLATDEKLLRPVVLKEVADDVSGAVREAQLAGALQHPHVVTVYDVVQRVGAPIIVTEYLARGSLEERLRAGKPPMREAVRILAQVLDGVAAVHARDVIHRDIKPSNVLLGADGNAKIADFGIARARLSATRAWGETDALGTPAYMAPEQRRGEPLTPASDVYMIGRLARETMPTPLPPALHAVIAKALADDPRERYRDGAEMLTAWREASAALQSER